MTITAADIAQNTPLAILGAATVITAACGTVCGVIRAFQSRPHVLVHYSVRDMHGIKSLCFGLENEPIYSKWITWWGVRRREIRAEIFEVSVTRRRYGGIAQTRDIPFHDGDEHIDVAVLQPTWSPTWAVIGWVNDTGVSVKDGDEIVLLAPETYSALVAIHYPDEEREMEAWERDFVVTDNGIESRWVDTEATKVV